MTNTGNGLSPLETKTRTLDALTQSLEECRGILKRLYPTKDVQSLLPLNRQELISLIGPPGLHGASSLTSPAGSNTSPQSQDFQSPLASTSDESQSLANLEQIPRQDTEWDEERRNREPIPAEADDVNGLSLSVDRQSSYLSATSIKAAFIVMLKVAPNLRSFLSSSANNNIKQVPVNSNYPTPRPSNEFIQRPLKVTYSAINWSSEGQNLIDAYFNRVQILIPMLDEPSFRADYLSGRRNDGPWLALLNMVFAMGSIVATKSDDHSHINYYNRAKEHLGIDTFGSGHLETLQAHALMGGLYLHYVNRPNMANAITGAALRMACASGLHRECLPEENIGNSFVVEQRRKTWWSLFCLDTWASTTLGRPSMGRWSPSVTIAAPEMINDTSMMGQHSGIMPLIENIKFCKIATQIQDVLAQSPLLRSEDRAHLDAQLVSWYENLPWILKSTEPCPDSLYTARCVMKWRYNNLRIVLHRPVLLGLANRGDHGYPPSPDELAALCKVRAIAKETIEDIARNWTPNQMLGWNGVWYMYQASMIPLVSMFWESWNTQLVRECQGQLEIVIDALEDMADWSLAARRSKEVVSKMYEASKRPLTCQSSPALGPFMGNNMKYENGMNVGNGINGMNMNGGSAHLQHHMNEHDAQQMDIMTEEGMVMLEYENVWDLDGMLWGNLPDGLDIPFDGVPMFEDGGMRYDGNYGFHQ
ncbi:fungal-specific transcription factor-like protein [Bisporella sp. PMI_857]|nr:fungal-specific transcription factor-like protein [Bisporella sp. PMI_857]